MTIFIEVESKAKKFIKFRAFFELLQGIGEINDNLSFLIYLLLYVSQISETIYNI